MSAPLRNRQTMQPWLRRYIKPFAEGRTDPKNTKLRKAPCDYCETRAAEKRERRLARNRAVR